MIPTVLGFLSILAGVGMVVYQAARNWYRRKERTHDAATDAPKPAMSYWVLVLIGLGALLIAIGTTRVPLPTP